tara:strand:- start:2517 stop:2927 length:411 start_codon:yes stop_codon:yes gene_type:complete
MKFNEYLKEHEEEQFDESFLKLVGAGIDKAAKKLFDKATELVAKQYLKRHPELSELGQEIEARMEQRKGRLTSSDIREFDIKRKKLEKFADKENIPDDAKKSIFGPLSNLKVSGLKNIKTALTSVKALNSLLGKFK